MKYVIIGNGTAAVGVIEGIRSADKVGPITVISTEPYHVYGRPLISYMLLGKTTEEKMLQYRPDDFYEKNHVTTMLGQTVQHIDPKSRPSRSRAASPSPMTDCASAPARARSFPRWRVWTRSRTKRAS